MQLVSLGLGAGHLTATATGIELVDGLPGPAQEILVRNLSRPDADNYGAGDVLLLRFVSNNGVFSLRDRLSMLMHEGRRTSQVVANRQAPRFPSAPRKIAPEFWPDLPEGQWVRPHDAPAFTEQLVLVEQVRNGAQFEVALSMLVPGAGAADFAFEPASADYPEPPPLPPAEVRPAGQPPEDPKPPTPGPRRNHELPHFPPSGLRALRFSLRVDGRRLVGVLGESPVFFRLETHPIRIALDSADNGNVASDPDGTLRSDPTPRWEAEDLTLTIVGRPFERRLCHGDRVHLRAWNGQPWTLANGASVGVVQALGGAGRTAVALRVERVVGPGEVQDGDVVRLLDASGAVLIVDTHNGRRLSLARVDPTRSTFTLRFTKPLLLTFSEQARDHASVATSALVNRREGYRVLGTQARIFIGPRPSTAPLKAYFNEAAKDTISTATERGETTPISHGYRYLGVQGYLSTRALRGTTPLKQYWNGVVTDNLLAGTPSDEQRARHGYNFAWIEGHAFAPSTPLPTLALDPAGARATPVVGGVVAQVTRPVRPTSPRREPVRALVLAGGGAKGAFEVGAARRLWETVYADRPPDIICGVSVGSVNGAKLAEGLPTSAEQLEVLWRSFSSGPGQIYRRDHYMKILHGLAQRLESRVIEAGFSGLLGSVIGSVLLPWVGTYGGGYLALMGGLDMAGTGGSAHRTLNTLLGLLHSQHSMEPLRQQIRRNLVPGQLARSGIKLRMGVTDVTTGQFFNVTGPKPEWADRLSTYGMIDAEPDHQAGESWLTRPLFGTSGYVMPLADAVYASSALPTAMEPLEVDLRECAVVRDTRDESGEAFTALVPRLPPGLRELLDATHQAASGVTSGSDASYMPNTRIGAAFWDNLERVLDRILDSLPVTSPGFEAVAARNLRDGSSCGAQSVFHTFLDGGLRDAIPIRTAIRLGAEEIIVVTGDRLDSSSYVYPPLGLRPRSQSAGLGGLLSAMGSANPLASPLAGHLMALVSTWANDSSRNDVMLALAHAEALDWAGRAAALLSEEERRSLERELTRRNGDRGRYLLDALGATSPLGGRDGFTAYSEPYHRRIRMSLINPDRTIIDALDFQNAAAVGDAIALGYRAADHPVVLVP